MNSDNNTHNEVPQISPEVANNCVDCNGDCCQGNNPCAGRSNLECYNWLGDLPGNIDDNDLVEVHFKNTRKSFYRNSAHLPIKQGDIVAVEANPGHDIGTVAMMGKLVKLQMKRANLKPDFEILRVFRKAKEADIERFEEAKAKETDTMIRSRQIAKDLGLKMKIGDVEYQGDGSKAIFYYIADERVDFRQLIKVLADVFKIRVEMKQIGARQEAGRIGGIGPCGRPLCCASWMTNFVSVTTGAARYQDISLNPQKLAGQCAKLKCCINFEVDSYLEAGKTLPPREVPIETKDNTYFFFKVDIFKQEVTYSTDKRIPANLVTISAARALELIAMNNEGIKPDRIDDDTAGVKREEKAFGDILGQDAINRFDKNRQKKKKGNRSSGQARKSEKKEEQHSGTDKERSTRTDSDTRNKQHRTKQHRGGKQGKEQNNNHKGGNDNKPQQ